MSRVLASAGALHSGEIKASNQSVGVELFAKAMLIRGVEQRLLSLFSEGKLFGTVHTCIGQEWTGIAVAEALMDGDVIFTSHRGHGHFLAHTGDVDGLIAEVMGKQAGVCGGRGGSQHLCSGGVFSNGIQGGIVPVAAGMALAHQFRETDGSPSSSSATAPWARVRSTRRSISPRSGSCRSWSCSRTTSTPRARRRAQTLAGDIEARAAAFGIETAMRRYLGPGHVDVDRLAVRRGGAARAASRSSSGSTPTA